MLPLARPLLVSNEISDLSTKTFPSAPVSWYFIAPTSEPVSFAAIFTVISPLFHPFSFGLHPAENQTH